MDTATSSYFYSYVLGVYGHFLTPVLYVDCIQNALGAAAEELPHTFHFLPATPNSYIPYSPLPLLTRQGWLTRVRMSCWRVSTSFLEIICFYIPAGNISILCRFIIKQRLSRENLYQCYIFRPPLVRPHKVSYSSPAAKSVASIP